MSMVLKDPVLDVKVQVSGLEAKFLAHPRMDRLKRIKQNGFTYVRYPRARHTRFEHSLGVLYWATLMHRRLVPDGRGLEGLRASALVHDVGHGPFSHALELILRRNPEWRPEVGVFSVDGGSIVPDGTVEARGHEDFTMEFVGSELYSLEPDIATEVMAILSGRGGILSTIISSDVDADRMDYLIRDAHYSGIPFGKGLGDLFRRVVENGMSVGEKAGREWVVLGTEAIRGIEMILSARFASYRTIYHEPISRTAESTFVSTLEGYLDRADDPRGVLKALFLNSTDEDFHNAESRVPIVNDVVSDPEVRGMMDRIDGLEVWNERRLMTLDRGALYNLVKVMENGRMRALESGLEDVFGGRVFLNVSIPNTLAQDLMADDPSLYPDYRPALLYDYSPLVKALEDSMYSSATIVSELDLGQAVRGRAMRGILRDVGGADEDTDRDIVSCGILTYVDSASKLGRDPSMMRYLQRRSTAIFGSANAVMTSMGRDVDVNPPESPWYGKGVYAVSRLLVFLRALVEVEDPVLSDGMYIPSYRCIPGPGLTETMDALALSPGARKMVRTAVDSFIASKAKAGYRKLYEY